MAAAALLLAITGAHAPQTYEILQNVGVNLPTSYVQWGWNLAQLSIFASVVMAVAYRSVQWLAAILLLIVSMMAPLFVTFGVYFVGQHSWTAWSHLQERLPKERSGLWLQALPFTVGAVLLFLASLLFFRSEQEFLLQAVIVFGSCVTFPHVLCMGRFYGTGPATVNQRDRKLQQSA